MTFVRHPETRFKPLNGMLKAYQSRIMAGKGRVL